MPDDKKTGVICGSFTYVAAFKFLLCDGGRLQALRQQHPGPGHRQELQVIVGIGNHSSEGEGSLGRVIESHLLGLNLAFRKRGGVIILEAV